MLSSILGSIYRIVPFLRCIEETKGTQTPVRLHHVMGQKFFLRKKGVYWPIDKTSIVSGWKNVYCGVETCPGYMPGCYIQGVNPIHIGDYTQISANVGLITANHDLYDLRKHLKGDGIHIGAYSWIGMNVVVLPDVRLGDFTIVGAGSVVTRSFPEGHCVIAGNPARKIKDLDKDKCFRYEREKPYNGFLSAPQFEAFRKEHLSV